MDKTGEDSDEFKFNENYVLMKGFVSIFTGRCEDEIRETITSLFKEKCSLIGKNDFVFLKREEFKLHHPAVCPGFRTLVTSKH